MNLNILQALLAGGAPPPPQQMPSTGGFGGPAAPIYAPAAEAPQAAQIPLPPPPPPQPAAPAAPAAPAHARRSILDTIGRISDVLAKVGGADALYQSTLDANTARENGVGDHARAVDLEKQKLALGTQSLESGATSLENHNNTRVGAAFRGLAAITASGGDPTKAWPILAAQLHVPPEQAKEIADHLATDPKGTIEAMNNALNPAATASKPKEVQVYEMLQTKDPTGKLAQQYLEGVADPKAITDYQERQLAMRDREIGIRDRTAADAGSDRDAALEERRYEFDHKPAAAGKGKAAAGGEGDMRGPLILLDNIAGGFESLHHMNALAGEGGVVGGAMGAFGRTAVGQALGEQAGNAAAQQRLAIAKNVSALQQAMLKSLPASATRTKFEQEMLARGLPDPSKMGYKTAHTVIAQLRESFTRAMEEVHASAGGTSASAPARSSGGMPPRIGARAAPAKPAGKVLKYNPATGKIE